MLGAHRHMASRRDLRPTSDRFAPEKRSDVMRQVRSRNTSPEIAVRKLLHRLGLRFRLHRKDLPGKPDVVLPKHRVIVFVNGCFWHQHVGCRRATVPEANHDWWCQKLARNVERDQANLSQLKNMGWRVMTVWQ
jgi:DNA mismatch endonuclease, patch repair protein